ncbi:MAG: hypothetical protein ACREIF_02295 [Chthoniobacterales bacterium]
MITRRVARLERFFLTPLVFVFPLLAVFYLFQRAWLLAAFMVFASFCIGLLGQSLHRDKTYEELKRGGLTSEENILPPSREISHSESLSLARSMLFASWICAIAVGILLSHYGYPWFTSIGGAIATGVFLPILLSLLVLRA